MTLGRQTRAEEDILYMGVQGERVSDVLSVFSSGSSSRQLGLAAAVSCHAADPVLVNVLPFSGKSIQVNPYTIGGSSCNCFSSNSAPFNPTIGSSTYQTIPAVITTGRFIDVNLAKKKLFVATRETGDPQTTISSQPTTNIASVGAQSAPAKFRSNWKYVCQN